MDIASGIGGGLGLAQGLFGTGTTQNQTQTSQTQFRPQDLSRIEAARGGYQGQVGDLLSQLTASREALQKGVVMPSSTFQFSTTPDVTTRGIVSMGQQQLAQNAAAAKKNIPTNLWSASPVAASNLARIVDINTRLQQNPLLFQATQQQRERELQQAQQAQNAAEAANRALFGREQALTGYAQTGVGAQQNLLSTLLSLGQALGQQQTTSSMRGRSGGLFS